MNEVRPGVVKNEASQPFRHVVIDQFPGFDAGLSTNELGPRGGKAVRPDLASLGPAYARLDQLLKSAERRAGIAAGSRAAVR